MVVDGLWKASGVEPREDVDGDSLGLSGNSFLELVDPKPLERLYITGTLRYGGAIGGPIMLRPNYASSGNDFTVRLVNEDDVLFKALENGYVDFGGWLEIHKTQENKTGSLFLTVLYQKNSAAD